jgi:type VI secretion system ImpC/EvpB family protein
MHCTFKELSRDVQTALEFDQSEAFRKIYSPFDTPGDHPLGLIIGDYEFTNHPDHIEVLDHMAAVAAAAFAPFITSASPTLLDLKWFADLERPLNLPATFAQKQYIKWRALREKDDMRFVGLTLPHTVMRAPYLDGSHRTDRFRFQEDTTAPDRSGYLWGSAAYSYAGMLIRTFVDAGWLADTRGVRKGEDVGGVVIGLPELSWESDRPSVAPRCPTDAIITDVLDRTLGELGFLPLCWCQDTHMVAFHGCQSLANPKIYDRAAATSNARLSAMLPYVLCASRFAHYLKVMMRDKAGGSDTPEMIEDFLTRWLQEYTNTSDSASPELKARFPLRDSRVEVKEVPGKPGRYYAHMFLQPQFQLDQLVGFIELKTRPDMRRS